MTDQPTMSNGRALLLLLEEQKNAEGIKGIQRLFNIEICNIAMSKIIATAPYKAGQHYITVQRVDKMFSEATYGFALFVKYNDDDNEDCDRYGVLPFSIKGNEATMPSMNPPNCTKDEIAITKVILAWLNRDCRYDGFVRDIVNEQIIKKESSQ